MKLIRVILTLAFFLGGVALVKAQPKTLSMDELNTLIDSANLIVDGKCSGTLIEAEKRLVLTNYHCVSSKITVREKSVVGDDGVVKKIRKQQIDPIDVSQNRYQGHNQVGSRKYRGQIVGHKKTRDLALIQIEDTTFPNTLAMKLADRKVQRGDRVTAIGNPMMLDASISTGVIASTTRTFKFGWADNEDLPMLQFTAGIAGGSSGGSLILSETGELIGVPAASARGTVVGLAIPGDLVREALREWCFASVYDRTADDAKCREKKTKKVTEIDADSTKPTEDMKKANKKAVFETLPFVE